MSLKRETPCDWGDCPYSAYSNSDCEWWCGADEPEDFPKISEEKEEEDKIWLIIEDAIDAIYRAELKSINYHELVRDLWHIQECIRKKVYEKEN